MILSRTTMRRNRPLKSLRRTAAPATVLFLVGAVAVLTVIATLRENTPDLLKHGVRLSKKTQDYCLQLEGGDFVHLSVEQVGVDVEVSIFDPSDRLLQVVDLWNSSRGTEELYLLAERTGRHRINVALQNEAAKGSFTLRLSELRSATDRDRSRVIAQRHMLTGHALVHEQRFGDALAQVEQALQIYQLQGDRRGIAQAVFLSGDINLRMFAWANAVVRLQNARDLWRVLGDDYIEALTENQLAMAQYRLGETDKALASYDRAIALSRECGDESLEADALLQRAMLYQGLGDLHRASDDLRRSITLSSEVGPNPRQVASRLVVLSQIQVAQEDKPAAESTLRRALETVRPVGDHAFESRVLLDLGRVYQALGRFEDSRKAYEVALFQLSALGDRSGETAAQLRLADLTIESKGDLEVALAYANRALEFSRMIADREGEVLALQSISRACRLAGDLGRARVVAEQAVRRVESMKPPVASPLEQSTWLKNRRLAFDELIAVLMAQHIQEPARALDVVAYNASEQQRAVGSIDFLSYTGGRVAPAARRPAVEPITLRATQTEVLDKGVLLLHYSLGEDRSYLWAVTTDSFTSHILPPRKEIEDAARRAHQLLVESRARKDSIRVRFALRLLGSMLLGPVAPEVEAATKLFLVPDGALYYIPFGALELSEMGRNWRLPSETVRMPSVSALAFIRQHAAAPSSKEFKVAIIADPVVRPDDPRLPDVIARPRLRPQDDRLTRLAATDFADYERLMGARLEAERIAALVDRDKRFEAYGFTASRETVFAGRLDDFRILHFATHSRIDPTHPGRSEIVLSLFDEDGRPQVGSLAAYEIAGLHLPAELVVLSACETGLGREIRGEGLMGLSQAFFSAGSRQVLASLWTVDDRATALLMEEFYRNLLVERLSASAALSRAQLWMQNQERWQDPYYWAGFVLQGDWR